MSKGVSLDHLGDLPLDSWVALYQIAKAEEMQALAAQVGVVHASDPRRLRDQLISEANVLLALEKRLWDDPQRLRDMAVDLGVKVDPGKTQDEAGTKEVMPDGQ